MHHGPTSTMIINKVLSSSSYYPTSRSSSFPKAAHYAAAAARRWNTTTNNNSSSSGRRRYVCASSSTAAAAAANNVVVSKEKTPQEQWKASIDFKSIRDNQASIELNCKNRNVTNVDVSAGKILIHFCFVNTFSGFFFIFFFSLSRCVDYMRIWFSIDQSIVVV
jgi:hypothetical protein